jgi:hypothetical protein
LAFEEWRLKMKTTISKNIRHSLLIEEGDLKSLHEFIASKYEKVEIVARCIDGSRLETREINEVVSLENPNYRKVKTISVKAQNDYTEGMSLDIWAADRVSTSAELEIDSNVDEQALYVSHEILNRLAEMKPWYDLLARVPVSYVLFGLWFTSGIWNTVQQLIGIQPPSPVLTRYSTIELLNFMLLFGIIALGIAYLLDCVQKYLFPKVFFLIGRQKKTMRTIQKWRGFIFGGVIFATIVGVIANAISKWLLR